MAPTPLRRRPRRRPPAPAAARGISLIEMLIVVVVASILLATAVPGMQAQLARSRLEGAATELAQDLYQARSEALRFSTRITLTRAADGAGYTLQRGDEGATPILTKTRRLPTGVTMPVADTDEAIHFTPLRGATDGGDRVLDLGVGPADARLTLRASITAAGRVRLCALEGRFPGYAPCA